MTSSPICKLNSANQSTLSHVRKIAKKAKKKYFEENEEKLKKEIKNGPNPKIMDGWYAVKASTFGILPSL